MSDCSITEHNIIEMYINQNKSKKDVAAHFGVSVSKLEKLMKQYGVAKTHEQIVNARKQGLLNKYGVDNAALIPGFAERSKKSFLEKYGVTNPSKSNEIKDKKKQTLLKNYGVDNPSKSASIMSKKQNTTMKNYGVLFPYQNEDIKNKAMRACQKKYGVSNFSQAWRSEQTTQILSSKESLANYLESIPFDDRTIEYLLDHLDITDSCLRHYIYNYELNDLVNYYTTSSVEKEVKKLISEWGIECYKTQSIIPETEIDLYCPQYNIGIELNGNFYHSNIIPLYHQNKSIKANEVGVFLYHIFEYEWKDFRKRRIIESQLKNLFGMNAAKVYARKCEVKSVDVKQCREFLDENHLQGYCNSSVKLGLFYNNELVSVMTFGTERFSRKGEKSQEMIRYCSKMGYSVIGGADKLFKYYLNTYNVYEVVSFCDIGKGRGTIYSRLGFQLDKICGPGYVWTKGTKVLSRYKCQMKNERKTMISQGYRQLFDCGNYKFIYKKDPR